MAEEYIKRSDVEAAFRSLDMQDLYLPIHFLELLWDVPAADVEPRQRWIPVTEGLPKRPKNWPRCELRRCYFLVALESGCVKSLGFEFATMEWHTVGSPVTHWMPLPEPPKETDGDEQTAETV